MPDRVHHPQNLIYSVGTQVVTLVEIPNQNGKVLHPRGSIGVIVRSPADPDHPCRVRFAGAIEESLLLDRPDYENANAYLIEARGLALAENLP
jgi:uncharacterized protein